jgi:Zn finger protein HypA/HybF involved in hydrogenase expression
MKRFVLELTMIVTCIAAAVGNVALAHYVGFNLFGLTFWFVVPLGAMIVGAIAASGAIVAARLFDIRPSVWQGIISATIIGAATMLLIYFLEYNALEVRGTKIRKLVDFWTYVDLSLTKSHMRLGRSSQDLGEAGDLGYLFMLLKLGGFVLGAFFIFTLIRGMAACPRCGAYFKTVRTKKSSNLPIEEAAAVHEQFMSGDTPAIHRAVTWPPEPRTLEKKQPKARLIYKLCQCPKCASRAVIGTMEVSGGREFKEVKDSKIMRELPDNDTVVVPAF